MNFIICIASDLECLLFVSLFEDYEREERKLLPSVLEEEEDETEASRRASDSEGNVMRALL